MKQILKAVVDETRAFIVETDETGGCRVTEERTVAFVETENYLEMPVLKTMRKKRTVFSGTEKECRAAAIEKAEKAAGAEDRFIPGQYETRETATNRG